MTVRRLLPLICLATTGLAAIFFLRRAGRDAGGAPVSPIVPVVLAHAEAQQAADPLTEEEFRRSLLESANVLRQKRGYRTLSLDPRIGQWLATKGSQISCANLQKVLDTADLPDFDSIRASGAVGGSLRDLLPKQLENLSAPSTGREDRFGILLRSLPGHEHEVVVVTGQSLPELTLAGLDRGSVDAFVSQCVHCGKRSAFHNEKTPVTLSLTCPGCGRCIRLLGRDTKGRYHDAPAFLIPSPCPEASAGSHPLDTMISVWTAAINRCRYVEDGDATDSPADSWQTPRQTLQKGTGDCEDSALLLTDWMLSNNIPARVAMGTMNEGGHAWCVVRVEATDYLLESTNRTPDIDNLPVVNPRDGYVPSALFDRDALYVRAQPGNPFDGDYWSPEKWIRLPYVRAAASPAKPTGKAKVAMKR